MSYFAATDLGERGWTTAVPSAVVMNAAKEPERKQDNYYKAQDTSQTGSAVAPITVVTSATAEKYNEDDNDHN
jgi:hypothetical protein